VFVNETLAELAGRARGLSAVQLHGTLPEPDAQVDFPWIVAAAIRDARSLAELTDYLARRRARQALPAAVLVDAHVAGAFGGTGQLAPWSLLADFHPGIPLILAGGLTPENVAAAIRQVRPYAVDVASGVESAPGHKDPEKMRRFIEEAKGAL
jgi:phosphoribosylanthranilate isomerase